MKPHDDEDDAAGDRGGARSIEPLTSIEPLGSTCATGRWWCGELELEGRPLPELELDCVVVEEACETDGRSCQLKMALPTSERRVPVESRCCAGAAGCAAGSSHCDRRSASISELRRSVATPSGVLHLGPRRRDLIF